MARTVVLQRVTRYPKVAIPIGSGPTKIAVIGVKPDSLFSDRLVKRRLQPSKAAIHKNVTRQQRRRRHDLRMSTLGKSL